MIQKDILNQHLNLSIKIRRVKMRENMISYKLKSYLSWSSVSKNATCSWEKTVSITKQF